MAARRPSAEGALECHGSDGRAALQTLPHDRYLALRADAAVLERDHHGDKVLKLADGSYLKLFRRKRLISSAAWYPYARRFADNARALEARGIPCPRVIAVHRIPAIARDAVHYRPLAGRTLRELVRQGDAPADLRERLFRFVDRLHGAGIYFRSLHLGNIVLTPGGEFGLIDIADLRAHDRPLRQGERRRNLRHLQRDPRDRAWLGARRILFLSKGADASSTRYRALQFFERLAAAGFSPAHRTVAGGPGSYLAALRAARQADCVVVLRKTFPALYLRLLRKCARRLLFDFDDAIFCNTDGSPSATRMARFAAMAAAADHVWAGNGFLAAQAQRFNAAVTVIPTSIDPARYAATASQPDDCIDLVWIGSRSTRKYLADALPWLALAAARIPRLRLKIVADFDLPGQGVATLPVPWSADGEAAALAAAHIGIAPLRDDDWSRGKCALKVLQYMAAGLPVVSSRAGANAEILGDGGGGLLAATPQEWVEHLAVLAADPGLRRRLGEAGRARVAADYSLAAAFARMRATLEETR